jgi:hypothetical protein
VKFGHGITDVTYINGVLEKICKDSQHIKSKKQSNWRQMGVTQYWKERKIIYKKGMGVNRRPKRILKWSPEGTKKQEGPE